MPGSSTCVRPRIRGNGWRLRHGDEAGTPARGHVAVIAGDMMEVARCQQNRWSATRRPRVTAGRERAWSWRRDASPAKSKAQQRMFNARCAKGDKEACKLAKEFNVSGRA